MSRIAYIVNLAHGDDFGLYVGTRMIARGTLTDVLAIRRSL